MKNDQSPGLIQVYTGNGKGKTTAALGMALRACGHGWKVQMISFMKGDPNYGEVIIADRIPNFELLQSGLPTFVKRGNPSDEDVRLAARGFEVARRCVAENRHRMVILDEINVAVDYGLVPLESLLKLAKEKPREMELVFTGRYAHPEILKIADLVSEILEIKHPYQKGISGREGIEH
jgi:cob(I)alamin adenosyltransferase